MSQQFKAGAGTLEGHTAAYGEQHRHKDTEESAAWDGSMAFDSAYSLKYVAEDTKSQIVFG